jgi:hypothetical protein
VRGDVGHRCSACARYSGVAPGSAVEPGDVTHDAEPPVLIDQVAVASAFVWTLTSLRPHQRIAHDLPDGAYGHAGDGHAGSHLVCECTRASPRTPAQQPITARMRVAAVIMFWLAGGAIAWWIKAANSPQEAALFPAL